MQRLAAVTLTLTAGVNVATGFLPNQPLGSFGLTRIVDERREAPRLSSAVAEAGPLFSSGAVTTSSNDLSRVEDGAYVMTVVERARSVAAACTSGTLSTACMNDEGMPFGSHVDYVLDAQGWPVLLLNEASLHTKNVMANPRASLFAQMPSKTGEGQPSAAMPRVTVLGTVVPVTDQDELYALRAAYSVAHGFAAMLVESDKFKFHKLKPDRVYYMGGFGVDAAFVDTEKYEAAEPDALALESLALVNKLNREQVDDLVLLCNQFVPGLDGLEGPGPALQVKVTTVDRLGMDLRVSTQGGAKTDEYRIGFQVKVLSMEDAKSEIVKIFQEAWEKEQGEFWEDMGPPVVKTQISSL